MIWAIAIILFVLWVIGLAVSYTLGGYIHVLLLIAVLLAIYELYQGKKTT